MAKSYLLTLAGRDQPGIVAGVTEALYRAGCNLGETSMIRLGDSFTVMMLVEGADEARLREALVPVVERMGLVLHVDPADGVPGERPEPDVRILVHGADRAGIVAEVTGRAAGAGLNIVDLESARGGSADRPIYILQIEGTAARGVDAIREVLDPLREQGVQVEVQAIDTLYG